MEITLFENGRGAWRAAFQAALTAQCNALGIPDTVAPDVGGAVPAGDLAVYFGNDVGQRSPDEGDRLKEYDDAGVPVLPVIDAPSSARAQLPVQVAHINAFSLSRYRHMWPKALVDEVLSLVWLRRRTRKVFLSYRRTDSEAIARQLHRRLTNERFEVFLDDLSIPPAADFQRDLKWWLNDADLVLLLVSPRVESSRWVLEEIAFAGLASVGMLGVRWPSAVYQQPGASPEPLVAAAIAPDQQVQMADQGEILGSLSDPPGQTLSALAEDRIVEAVLVQRARAIRQRLVNLLPFARDRLGQAYAVTAGDRLGDLMLEDRASNDCVLARVLPFRPTVEAMHDLYVRATELATTPAGIGCFYQENDPLDRRVRSLQWLLSGRRTGAPYFQRLWPYLGAP